MRDNSYAVPPYEVLPGLEIPHIKVHYARNRNFVNNIPLGLTGRVDSKDSAILFVKRSALDTAVRSTGPADHVLQMLVGTNPEERPAIEAKLARIWRAIYTLSKLVKWDSRSNRSPIEIGICSEENGG